MTSLKLRQATLERDSHTCVNCSCTEDLYIHHIVPRSVGGEDKLSNLCTLCGQCHSKVHDRNLVHIRTLSREAQIKSGNTGGRPPLSLEKMKEAVALRKAGLSYRQISNQVGISLTSAWKVFQQYEQRSDQVQQVFETLVSYGDVSPMQ